MSVDPQVTAAIVSVLSGLVIGLGFVVFVVASDVKAIRERQDGDIAQAHESRLDRVDRRLSALEGEMVSDRDTIADGFRLIGGECVRLADLIDGGADDDDAS